MLFLFLWPISGLIAWGLAGAKHQYWDDWVFYPMAFVSAVAGPFAFWAWK